MANHGERAGTLARWLKQRIREGEVLLAELPPRSGWAPIVQRKLRELRDSLAAFKQAENTGDADQRRNARAWIGFVNDRLKIAS